MLTTGRKVAVPEFLRGFVRATHRRETVNSRERVLTALSCRQPDRVPMLDHIDVPVIRELAVTLGIQTPETETTPAEDGISYVDLYCRVLDRLGLDGVMQLLGGGRKDESGEFTPGAKLTPEQAAPVRRSHAAQIRASGTGARGLSPAGRPTRSPDRRAGPAARPARSSGRPCAPEEVTL